MQEEEKNIQTVGFSDYVNCYETLRKLKEAQLLAKQHEMLPKDQSTSFQEHPFDQQRQVPALFKPIPNETSSSFPLKTYARGRNISAMAERLNSRLTKRGGLGACRSMPISFPVASETVTSKPVPISERTTENYNNQPTRCLEITGMLVTNFKVLDKFVLGCRIYFCFSF